MIHSMTGYGRATCEVEGVPFLIEMRAVNHRHLDLQLRLPRALGALEAELRGRLRDRLARGKLDVNVSLVGSGSPGSELQIDRSVAAGYVDAARTLGEAYGLPRTLDAAVLLNLPGVARLADSELATESLTAALGAALDEALAALLAMRRQEGEALDRDLRQRLASITDLVAEIETRKDDVQSAVRERLRKRAAQLEQETGILDEARLHQEIVLAADRMDVSEELVRLRSHVEQFLTSLTAAETGEGVGRRLEFLLQEMVRESNTIGSKASDAPVAHRVVDLKTELERMREQVLNVE